MLWHFSGASSPFYILYKTKDVQSAKKKICALESTFWVFMMQSNASANQKKIQLQRESAPFPFKWILCYGLWHIYGSYELHCAAYELNTQLFVCNYRTESLCTTRYGDEFIPIDIFCLLGFLLSTQAQRTQSKGANQTHMQWNCKIRNHWLPPPALFSSSGLGFTLQTK